MNDYEDKAFWIYFAGFVDADGSIGMRRNWDRGQKRFYYKPFVSVSQKDKAVLEFFKSKIGCGYIAESRWKGRKYWILMFASFKDVKYILEKICPYLVVKKEKALFVLKTMDEVLKLYDGNTRKARWGKVLTQAYIEYTKRWKNE